MEKNTFFSEGAVVSVLTAEPIDKLLDYSVLQGGVYVGEFVEIELGNRTVLGLVWGSQVSFLEPGRLKVIKKRLKNFKINKNTRIFIKRMADYYLTSENKIFRLTSWKNFLKGGGKISYGYELEKIELRDVISLVTSKGRRVIEFLSANNEVQKPKTISQITEAASVSPSVIESLRRRGFIKKVIIKERGVVSRTRLSYRASLNTEQKMASEEIKQNMSGSCFGVTLLRGITGSGKTEVFLDQAATQIAKGFQVLILVPEIGLSSALVSRIEKKLGIKALEWNSEVSNSTKIKIFEYLMSDNEYAQIIVGARSALFLPIKRLGLIIIDEEHDISFKQQDGIRFNARDMAVLRGQCEQIHVILSSATPSLETILNCKIKKYKRVDITKRYVDSAEISTKIIDMKNEQIESGKSLSPSLIKLIKQHLTNNGQVLLFLNRRGYAPLVVCKKCGKSLSCNNCDSRLVEHKKLNCRLCHQCGYEAKIHNSCVNCGVSGHLRSVGFGVERLLEECEDTFPKRKIAIISSDQVQSKETLENDLLKIEKGEIDLIIGTQIIAKGHNFPFLSLVGIVDGDLGLHNGDLRSAEKTYQMTQQVSGRVGRFGKEGIIAIQSWVPNNEIIDAILSGKEEEFWNKELIFRKMAHAPPYSKFIAIILEGRQKSSLYRTGYNVSTQLKKSYPEGLKIFGPALAPISRVKRKIRVRLLIQCKKQLVSNELFRKALLASNIPKSQKLIIDVDPQSFL